MDGTYIQSYWWEKKWFQPRFAMVGSFLESEFALPKNEKKNKTSFSLRNTCLQIDTEGIYAQEIHLTKLNKNVKWASNCTRKFAANPNSVFAKQVGELQMEGTEMGVVGCTGKMRIDRERHISDGHWRAAEAVLASYALRPCGRLRWWHVDVPHALSVLLSLGPFCIQVAY